MSEEVKQDAADRPFVREVECLEVKPKKKTWFGKLIGFFWNGTKKLFNVVIHGVMNEVAFVLNDEENQALTISAIETAAKEGLKGRAAFDRAAAIVKAGHINVSATAFMKGSDVPTNILETLVQLVYTCVKTRLKK